MTAAVPATAARKTNRRIPNALTLQAKRWLRRSRARNRREPPLGFLAVLRKTRDAAVPRRLCVRNPHTPSALRRAMGARAQAPEGAKRSFSSVRAVRQRLTTGVHSGGAGSPASAVLRFRLVIDWCRDEGEAAGFSERARQRLKRMDGFGSDRAAMPRWRRNWRRRRYAAGTFRLALSAAIFLPISVCSRVNLPCLCAYPFRRSTFLPLKADWNGTATRSCQLRVPDARIPRAFRPVIRTDSPLRVWPTARNRHDQLMQRAIVSQDLLRKFAPSH
jgi:hypothetical protein